MVAPRPITMLTLPDSTFVDSDPELPGLGLLLDDDAFAEALCQCCPNAGLQGATANYVRYKRGVSCLVGYTLNVRGEQHPCYARAHTRAARAKMQKPSALDAAPGPLGPGIIMLGEMCVVVHVFPNDYELRVLRRLAQPEHKDRLFASLLPKRPDLWDGDLTLLRYKPERRYVARLAAPGAAGARLKFYRPSEFRVALNAAKRFTNNVGFRIAPPIGWSRRHAALSFEWMAGDPIHALLPCSESAAHELGGRIGLALAQFHAQHVRLSARIGHATLIERLHESSAAIAALLPDLEPEASALVRRLAEKLNPDAHFTPMSIHGDFSRDQLLFDGDTIVLLDLDRAAIGDPMIDIGRFWADLEADALAGRINRETGDSLVDGVIEAYSRDAGNASRERARWHAAAGLLHVAVEPFRLRDSNWAHAVAQRLTGASELAEHAATGTR